MIQIFKRYHYFFIPLLLLLVGFCVYSNTLTNGFVYDDLLVTKNNPFLQSLSNAKFIFSKDYFSGSGEFTYRPILTLTYLLDYHFWKTNPFGFHLVNVSLHILNSILVYFLLLLLLPIFSSKSQRFFQVSFLVSIIFLLHPVQTEVVNGIGFREDLLFTFFLVLALIFYLKLNTATHKIGVYFFAVICYFFGLFSKESTIIFIPLVLLLDYAEDKYMYFFAAVIFFLQLFFGIKDIAPIIFAVILYIAWKSKYRLEKLKLYPVFAIVTVFFLATIFVWLLNPVAALRHSSSSAMMKPELMVQFLDFVSRIAAYLKLLFFPAQLNIEYINPNYTSISSWAAGIDVLIFLVFMVLFLLWSLTRKIYSFCLFIIILPLTLVMMGRFQYISERHLYFSVIGFGLLASILFFRLYFNLKQGSNYRKLMVIFISIILCLYSLRVYTRNKVWASPVIFWQERVKQNPVTERAYSSLGDAYADLKDWDKAIEFYKKAIEINSTYPDAYNNIAYAYIQKKQYDEAILFGEEAVKRDPSSSKIHFNLAVAYQRRGMNDQALKEYKAAKEYNPFLAIENDLGTYYLETGEIDKSIEEYEKAFRDNPTDGAACYNLGNAYLKKGDNDKAIEWYKKALEINPKIYEANNNLGSIYLNKGLYLQAMQSYQNALEIDPSNYFALYNMGNIHLFQEHFDTAINFYLKALKTKPDLVEAHNNLGVAYYKKGSFDKAKLEWEEVLRLNPNYPGIKGNLQALNNSK